jgi:pimeloyl-ACP methyl ester carboxylesterase
MKALKIILLVFVVLCVVYMFGPVPKNPVYGNTLPNVPSNTDSLIKFIDQKEKQHKVKQGNNSKIIWFDSLHKKTEYAIVYLHGFSASHEEGNPIHTNISKKFGCNLYLSRLADHGIDTTEELLNMTAENLWESAKEALAIGKQLGHKVILMGTSTGASLALHLASEYSDINSLILMSPNIAINNPTAWVLNNHWGLQIARMVNGSKYNYANDSFVLYKNYWNWKYRIEALVQLQEYLETAMIKEKFDKINQPVLCLYYYKDEQHQDQVIKVSDVKKMLNQLKTPEEFKIQKAIPNAENHVLGSYVLSKDLTTVENEISSFITKVAKPK